jgi:hypothetical protein
LQMIKDNQARVSRTGFTDVHPSEYFYTYRHIQNRLEQMIKAKTFSQLLPFDLSSHVTFKNKYDWKTTPKPIVGLARDIDHWCPNLTTGSLDDYFLGKWENLFSEISDRSDVLRWEALLWIGKDYNNEGTVLCKPIEAMIKDEHNVRLDYGVLPYMVEHNPNRCPTSERRYKWIADAQLDTVWYNWPIIPGKWNDWEACVCSYTCFWIEHRHHRDPVCFRAAIFCKALANWCQFFKIIIDPRLGGRMLQDGELYAKLNYNCCRKMRLLELMFLMQFLQGGHDNFVDDKKSNRKGAPESFLNRDRDGSLKRERVSWRKLSLDCDGANQLEFEKGATRPVYQMPLQWTPNATYFPIPYTVSCKSGKLPQSAGLKMLTRG